MSAVVRGGVLNLYDDRLLILLLRAMVRHVMSLLYECKRLSRCVSCACSSRVRPTLSLGVLL